MNKRVLSAILLSCSLWVHAQHTYQVQPVAGVNTERDEILCGQMEGRLILTSNDHQDLVNDYQWNTHFIYRLKIADRRKTYLEVNAPEKLLPFPSTHSEGSASWDPVDSVLYFSTSQNYGKAQGGFLKIYRARYNGRGWDDPELLPVCTGPFDYAHPFFDPASRLLVFSSNRPGGVGGMDIWWMYQSAGSWTDPVNPGMMVNSTAQELFPSIHRGDIYYSSNGLVPERGYDLFRCEGRSQWKVSVQLPEPLNSATDDVMIWFLNDEKGFVSSNRPGGKGGDDVYLFERFPLEPEVNRYTIRLEEKGANMAGTSLLVTNDLKEVVLEGVTNQDGMLSLRPLRLNQQLRLAVVGVDPSRYQDIVLYLMDDTGNTVRVLRLNEFGWVDLELLPFTYHDITLFPEDDESILTIALEGRIVAATPEAKLSEQRITIVDANGKPVAVAYTNESGDFSFGKLFPELSYTFRLDGDGAAKHVVLTDNGTTITLPVLKEEAVYQRLKEDEAIRLTNELNQVVYVSPKDLFVIDRVYYGSNSADLSDEAQVQLDQLADVLVKNPHLSVELISHTDSRGQADANLRLSRERVESVMQYLRRRGVDGQRMKGEGRGEAELLNGCADGVDCPDALHAVNRRTEIRILAY